MTVQRSPRWRERHTFSTFAETFAVTPLRYYAPRNLAEVREIVADAARLGYRVRAVGAAHSWSDVALCPDVMIDTRRLCNPLETESHLLRPGRDPETLFRVEAGMLVRDLAAVLKAAGKALPNISGFIGQTIVGAAQTATHGTGLGTGPLSDFVASLDLLNARGELTRVEPAGGITDPAAFRASYPERRLIQDDARFNAVTVGMGCMGIICSVYVDVVPYYRLREDRVISAWSDVKAHVLERAAAFRHYEFSVNPYPKNGRNSCLELMYSPVHEPVPAAALRPRRKPTIYVAATVPGATAFLSWMLRLFPRWSPGFLKIHLHSLEDRGYISGYEIALTLGTLTDVAVRSCEYALPMSRCVEAVDTLLRLAETSRSESIYHTIPVIVRFVKKTSSYLAMQYGDDADEDFCMVECPSILGTTAAMEEINRYERAMCALGGRPHWGQFSYLSGSNEIIRRMYPKLDEWLTVFREFNDTGMFDNAFTDRLGFSQRNRG
ncbi:MAG: FAD-binding protein [Candidatus Eremiobacteraeota bacterium]|nr:FAD-binding protein [Candidatus Eremiobacteraeota bacterium]